MEIYHRYDKKAKGFFVRGEKRRRELKLLLKIFSQGKREEIGIKAIVVPDVIR